MSKYIMKIQLLLPISIFLLLPSLCLAGSKINSKDSAYCEQNSSNIIDCIKVRLILKLYKYMYYCIYMQISNKIMCSLE